MFRDADAEHRNQYRADRSERDKVRDHAREECRHRRTGQLIDDDDRFARSRIDDVERYIRQQPREKPDDKQQCNEKYRGIGQLVANAFDGCKHSLAATDSHDVFLFFRHGLSPVISLLGVVERILFWRHSSR